MATITKYQPRYLGNADGKPAICRGGPESPDIKETASQSYLTGAPVYYDSNGTIAVNATGDPVTAGIAGFATKKATGTTGTAARYRVLRPGDRYIMNCADSETTALTNVGLIFPCDVASGILLVDTSTALVPTADAGNTLYCRILGLYTAANGYPEATDAVGDVNGRYIVEFPAQAAMQG